MNNQILEFEAIISNGESSPSLAKTMMMFMVKDLMHKFDYPYKYSYLVEKRKGSYFWSNVGSICQAWKDWVSWISTETFIVINL